LADLLLAALSRLKRTLDVGQHRVQRDAHPADLGVLIGVLDAWGDVDRTAGQRELRDLLGTEDIPALPSRWQSAN
jgi:hypothetical protein